MSIVNIKLIIVVMLELTFMFEPPRFDSIIINVKNNKSFTILIISNLIMR